MTWTALARRQSVLLWERHLAWSWRKHRFPFLTLVSASRRLEGRNQASNRQGSGLFATSLVGVDFPFTCGTRNLAIFGFGCFYHSSSSCPYCHHMTISNYLSMLQKDIYAYIHATHTRRDEPKDTGAPVDRLINQISQEEHGGWGSSLLESFTGLVGWWGILAVYDHER